MAGSIASESALTRVELREVLDGIRDVVVRNFATKADFESIKIWILGILGVVVPSLVGTVGATVAFVLTG